MNVTRDYRVMRRIRAFEERTMELKELNEIPGSIHLCIGQEAIPVGATRVLRDSDYVTATYRGHGWALARQVEPAALFAEMMGHDSALCGGRAGSPYFSDRRCNFLGENSIVGAGMPIAAGAALSAKRRGDGTVCVVSIGEGALNQGAVHEALNLAAVFALPLITVVENNVWSEMSRIKDMAKVERLSERAAGYGIPGVTADGNDPDAIAEVMGTAVGRAREGGGPTLVEAVTERLVGHYSGDIQHYRPKSEIEEAWQREPLLRMRQANPDLAAEFDAIDRDVAAEINAAVVTASAVPAPDPATAKDHVYA